MDGWRYIAGHPTIRITMLVAMMAQFFGMSFTTLLPVFARDVLGVGPAGQGFLLTALGMGALCSAFLLASLGDNAPRGRLMLLGVALYGVMELSFSTSHWFALSVGIMVLVGLCHVAANALVQTIVQGNTDSAVQGRVMASFQQIQVFYVVGGLAAGAAASAWGAPTTVAAMGTTCTLGAIAVLLTVPLVRRIR